MKKKQGNTKEAGDKEEITLDQDGRVKSGKSGQGVAKKSKPNYSKAQRGYWLDRLIKGTYTVDGKSRETADWCMRVKHSGTRKTVNLKTPNKATAAEKAAKFWRDLTSQGWKYADSQLNPGAEEKKPQKVTVGELIKVSEKLSGARAESLESYARALRTLASNIAGIKDSTKYDPKNGAKAWRQKVDAIPLERLTPAAVIAWKNKRMKSASKESEKHSMAVTVNSILRCSKAIVNKKIKSFIEGELSLPSPLWFEGVPMETEPSLRYRSKIDHNKLIGDARSELLEQKPEVFKAFILTSVFALRRSEADTLLWSQMDLKKGLLSIHDTEFKRLKSKDSAGVISIDKELIPVLASLQGSSTGKFVLETPALKRKSAGGKNDPVYRCNRTLNALRDWLKGKGVEGKRPLHTMRKEVGSVIASDQGIFNASRYLRHSNIEITARIYADTKVPVSVRIGALFATGEAVSDAAEDQKAG
jgi:integrase